MGTYSCNGMIENDCQGVIGQNKYKLKLEKIGDGE